MTVQTQMQTAIASAQSVEASLTQFALETQNQDAKQTFQQLAQQQKILSRNWKVVISRSYKKNHNLINKTIHHNGF